MNAISENPSPPPFRIRAVLSLPHRTNARREPRPFYARGGFAWRGGEENCDDRVLAYHVSHAGSPFPRWHPLRMSTWDWRRGSTAWGSALPVALFQHFVNGARLPSALRFALRRTVLELPPLFPLVILGHIPAPEPPTGLLGADLGPVNQTELNPGPVYDIVLGFLGVFLVRFVSVKDGLASGTCVRFREIRKPVPALLGIPFLQSGSTIPAGKSLFSQPGNRMGLVIRTPA